MGCYVAPAAAFIVHKAFGKRLPKTKELSLLLLGGALFGVVDHAWNRELLAFGARDLFLGLLITASLFLAWGFLVWSENERVTVRS